MNMTLALPPGAGIGDEDVANSAPLVRAEVTRRLEQIWSTCAPHIQVPLDQEGVPLYKADPRFIEAGIRVIDRLMKLYRLDQPQPPVNDPVLDSRRELREAVAQQIMKLGSKMSGDGVD